ncbi:porin family protein [Bacteroidetes bacterium endosymbiont of Geopemphigus sp.]|uniref:hypothetical protein n=1 Tax=Bacteroidetes bacterium endosymbiont of Geopemphigus sp. TaxID=2047937 RepID=UPI0039778CCA
MSKLGNSSGVKSSSLRSGMHARVYLGYILADGFSIQTELIYSHQIGKEQGVFTRRLDYINLPVILHYIFPSSMLSGFYLELDHQIGFVINNQLKSS